MYDESSYPVTCLHRAVIKSAASISDEHLVATLMARDLHRGIYRITAELLETLKRSHRCYCFSIPLDQTLLES
jgi:hypothetical protein